MTVGELIERLKNINPEIEVKLECGDMAYGGNVCYDIDVVSMTPTGEKIVIQQNDVDDTIQYKVYTLIAPMIIISSTYACC
jgi:hypothetical protein